MATLFNCNNDSFIDFVKKHTQNLSKDNSYKFYAMTCYFKQDATKELAELIHAILENSLCEFHLLIDINEYCQELLDIDSFISDLEKITRLSSKNISITPISPSPKPLFHAKGYALINCDHKSEAYYQGFGIITSANLSNGGIRENIEIGHIFDDNNSLRDFYNIFIDLKNNYRISEKELEERLQKQRELVEQQKQFAEKQRKSQKVVNLLSLGSFYHKWQQDHLIDLRFIVKLSKDAKKRIKNTGNEVSIMLDQEGFEEKEKEDNFAKKPIDIEKFFKLFPKIIPDILGICSIDTLLGKWIPKKISKLIEKELDERTDIYIRILKKHLEENLTNYLEELKNNIEKLQKNNIIDRDDEENINAIPRWEEKITKISQDKNLLKLLLWKYQIIPISLDSIQDPDLILTLYDRLHDLYQPNINRKGKVGKIFSDNSENNYEGINSDSFNGIYKEVEDKLNDNRLGDLSKKDNQGKYFCAIVKPEDKIVTGIFIRLEESSLTNRKQLIFYQTEVNKQAEKEENLLVNNLVTFKIIGNEYKEILYKFGFI
jgi:hypothetical protein